LTLQWKSFYFSKFYRYVYVFCEKAEKNSKGGWDYEVKPYKPANFLLQEIAIRLANTKAHWDSYVEEGLRRLRGVPGRWEAPASGTDRLCVDVGHGAYIEVSHPRRSLTNYKCSLTPACEPSFFGYTNVEPVNAPVDAGGSRWTSLGISYRRGGARCVHCAPVAGGRAVAGAGDARAAFAAHARARAYDCELDAVLDSVVGNRKDCFLSVRGISDYRDGTRGKEWQPRAALCAAAVMKAIVAAMDPPTD
ncbi:uncharacterized protein LOC119192915, partial [Manduca sexta]|uniref:uncharacterized protein LOC119192915 n=1 Tax=Manduca sexta TaxID=7130 RepID=UPI00188E60D9